MEFIGVFFHEVLYRPLLNALVGMYVLLPLKDFGVTVLLLTALTRIAFLPLSLNAARSQRALLKLQPKIKETQNRFQNNKERQMKEVMALYREHKVNPFGGCVPILLQLPILIALYRVFIVGITPESMSELYSFIARPETIQTHFFGVLDLMKPSPLLAILAGLSQFWLSKLMQYKTDGTGEKQPQAQAAPDFNKALAWQMTYFFPFFTVFIAWSFPAALALYWTATTVFSAAQQVYVNRRLDGDAAKKSATTA